MVSFTCVLVQYEANSTVLYATKAMDRGSRPVDQKGENCRGRGVTE